MKAIGFAWILLTLGALAVGAEFNYSGQFEEVYWNGKPCDDVFQTPEYRLNLILSESSKDLQVKFLGFDLEGFLNEKSLQGNISENKVLTAIASFKFDNGVLKLTLEGHQTEETVFFDLKATVIDSDAKILCRGRGTFTAFQLR